MILVFFLISLFFFLPSPSFALKNPYALYCQEMGYEYKIDENHQDFCIMPDGHSCLAADFFQGTCGQPYNYCAQKGFKSKISQNLKKCSYLSDSCLICLDSSGRVLGMAFNLLGISLKEAVCGDDICSLDENSLSCPSDCQPQPNLQFPSPSCPQKLPDYNCDQKINWQDLKLWFIDFIKHLAD